MNPCLGEGLFSLGVGGEALDWGPFLALSFSFGGFIQDL